MMDCKNEMRKMPRWTIQIGNWGLQMLWYFLHFIVSLWYFALGIADVLESYLISSWLLKKYKSIDVDKLKYLAIVIGSEEACQTLNVIKLLQWLVDIGAKNVCLYDAEGVLKKSKESILEKLNGAVLFEEADDKYSGIGKKLITLEFASLSDGKEAVVKAANVLFQSYLKLGDSGRTQEEQFFTEAHMSEALRAIGCGGPDPDILLVYGPARCHQGFPPWRIRYTEIVHMGPLQSMRYGSLVKAIYKFTLVRQNYGK